MVLLILSKQQQGINMTIKLTSAKVDTLAKSLKQAIKKNPTNLRSAMHACPEYFVDNKLSKKAIADVFIKAQYFTPDGKITENGKQMLELEARSFGIYEEKIPLKKYAKKVADNFSRILTRERD